MNFLAYLCPPLPSLFPIFISLLLLFTSTFPSYSFHLFYTTHGQAKVGERMDIISFSIHSSYFPSSPFPPSLVHPYCISLNYFSSYFNVQQVRSSNTVIKIRNMYSRNYTCETLLLNTAFIFPISQKHLLVQLYTDITAGMEINNSFFINTSMEIGSKVFLKRFSGIHSCKLVIMVDYISITYFHM